jgi:hypothetical protein
LPAIARGAVKAGHGSVVNHGSPAQTRSPALPVGM